MKKIIIPTLAAAALIIGATACTPAEPQKADKEALTSAHKAAKKDAPAPAKQDDGPQETLAQANARQSAADYLDMSGFSRSGLIDQLKYEGFSNADATYGVDANHPNWTKQAKRSALDYLDTSTFSHSGLVEQLEYEGFTHAQAEAGVKATGL